MIQIFIPDNHQAERIYTIDVLLGEFLGLKYQIVEKENLDATIIQITNGHQLYIQDHFFNNYQKQSYLKEEAIPNKVEQLTSSPYITESDLPIIFGQAKIEKKEVDGQKQIHCSIDIFASSFFMLSRWEEYVIQEKDEHQRFVVKNALAHQHDFLYRPIVNEYVELLWNMLTDLEIQQKRRQHSYQLLLTHDVDFPLRWWNAGQLAKEVIGDVFKRKALTKAGQHIQHFIQNKKGTAQDPYDTFDFLMDESEKKGVKSHFFFLSGGTSQYDSQHKMDSPFLLDLYKKIKERGHVIGFHPSYESHANARLWKSNYEELKNAYPNVQACGRQHFLRFEVPTTWQIWEDNQMDWDSTMGYADEVGFRCGTCYEFPVFNILTRQKLQLRERPLILMDVTLLLKKPNMTLDKYQQEINTLVNTIKKYQGTFTVLWHNSSFYMETWADAKMLYKEILVRA